MDLLDTLLDKFAAAEAIWFASVRPDGRPHLAPIWHVWHQNAAWVITQDTAVRARNIEKNPAVSLSLGDPVNALIMEGTAEHVLDAIPFIGDSVKAKYDWDLSTDAEYGYFVRVTPSKLMAWGNHGQGRWRYDPATLSWEQLA